MTVSLQLNAQDYAISQLEESPRHHEWVKINYDYRTLHAFVAFPEKPEPTLSVIAIHENRGLTDWVRSFADQLAAEGYLVIAPDFLSDFSDEYERTSDFPTSDEARQAIYQLDPEQITKDLYATRNYIGNHDASNGKVVVVGFCWGGSQTFRFATNSDIIEAAMVFYGSPPDSENELAKISCPVYGFYGENDARINSTITDTEEKMKKLGKIYKYEIYDGAGHAFMRRGDDPEADEMSKKARDDAFARLIKLLGEID